MLRVDGSWVAAAASSDWTECGTSIDAVRAHTDWLTAPRAPPPLFSASISLCALSALSALVSSLSSVLSVSMGSAARPRPAFSHLDAFDESSLPYLYTTNIFSAHQT